MTCYKYNLIKIFLKVRMILILSFLIIQNLFANENSTHEPKKFDFHFGFELSELMQNQFSNLGNKNYTFFFGQQFYSERLKNFGYRILLINVELSSEHLRDNPSIKGDKSNLEGNLTVGRLFLDYWHPTSKIFGFVSFQPVFSIGLGYNRNQIRKGDLGLALLFFQSENLLDIYYKLLTPPLNSQTSIYRVEPLLYYYYTFYLNRSYDLKGHTFDFGFRLQTQFWNVFFIEFPVIDVFLYLWKNQSTRGSLESTKIEFPEWGMLFLWINVGYKASF